MPQLPPANQPYDLTTEHGRAQSFAHSPYGAMLAEIMEQNIETAREELATSVDEAITKQLEGLNNLNLDDKILTQNLWIFHSELGARDKNAFAKLVREYEEERAHLVADINTLLELVNQVRELHDLENETEDE
jgi:uncharacterized protein YbgA (DUF1722 family)